MNYFDRKIGMDDPKFGHHEGSKWKSRSRLLGLWCVVIPVLFVRWLREKFEKPKVPPRQWNGRIDS